MKTDAKKKPNHIGHTVFYCSNNCGVLPLSLVVPSLLNFFFFVISVPVEFLLVTFNALSSY